MQVHLVDDQGLVCVEDDQEPQVGAYPTSQWAAGETVGDQFDLELPPTMPPVEHGITVSVYNPESGQNLGVQDAAGKLVGDKITVSLLRVQKNQSNITATELVNEGDYSVVVQLRDASGRVAFEQESRPADGAYPTTDWAQGEVLLNWHDLELPSSMSTGDYAIHVLLRQPVNGAILGDIALQPVSIRARE